MKILRPYSRYLAVFPVLLTVVGCVAPSTAWANASDDSAGVPAPRVVRMARPTVADGLVAQRVEALFHILDRPMGPVRELANAYRNEKTARMKTLLSAEPVEAHDLNRARRFAQRMLEELEPLRDAKAPPPQLVVQRQGSIVVDGQLGENAWKRAAEIPIHYLRRERVTGDVATVKLLWDADYLYAGFTVPDTNIIAPQLPRDGPVWMYDCVELFLLPSRRFNTYWEVNISPTGSILDSLSYKYSDRFGSDMRLGETLHGMRFASTIRGTPNDPSDVDEGYTVEVAIPWRQLPGFRHGARHGDQIYALLTRVDADIEKENAPTRPLAHVPYIAWFHNIWNYQPLVLSR